jgi:hypothetical protein
MNVRKYLAMGATLILGLVLGSVFSWQPSFAQPRMEQMTAGRYQVTAFGHDPNQAGIVVIDTVTGQCWNNLNQRKAEWKDMGSPPLRGGK